MIAIKRFIPITIILFVLFQSCNITQEYTFNKDFSGTSNLEIDMSAMVGMLGGVDSSKSLTAIDTLSQSLKKIAEEFEKLGAKNIKFGDKNNKMILFISYEFDNIDVLNKVISANGTNMLNSNFTDTTAEKAKFIQKGKYKLIYIAPKIKNDTLLHNKDMEAMKDYYNYTLKFNFATKIKKLKSEKATLSSNKKTIQFSGSVFDVFSPDYSTNFKLKLKHK